jgi:hypothetical protein
MTKYIKLEVPEDFQVPTFFNSLSPEETGRVLTLASAAYISIKTEDDKLENKEVYKTLIAEAEKKYEPRLESLKAENLSITETLSGLKRKLQEETTARIDTERRVREEEKRNREEILKEKDSRIQALESQVKNTLVTFEHGLRESSRSLTDKLESVKDQMLKTGSQKKGAAGEVILTDCIQKAFGSGGIRDEFSLEDVGKEGHQGDMHMKWMKHTVLWESKNYTRSVNQEEVNKFLRDMETNPTISLGLMVSLTSGIVGHQKNGGIDIQELRDGRICIYINNLLKHEDPTTLLQSLKPFMETFINNRKPLTLEENTESQQQIEHLNLQRTIVLRLLQNHYDSTRKFKNTLANAKKRSDEIWTGLTVEMRESEHQVKLLLETIQDNTKPESSTTELPVYIFRHTTLSMYNDKERKFIEDTRKIFTFSEEYNSSSKTVKEIYKTIGYNEGVVDSMRPKIFNDNFWGKGVTSIQGMKPLAP